MSSGAANYFQLESSYEPDSHHLATMLREAAERIDELGLTDGDILSVIIGVSVLELSCTVYWSPHDQSSSE